MMNFLVRLMILVLLISHAHAKNLKREETLLYCESVFKNLAEKSNKHNYEEIATEWSKYYNMCDTANYHQRMLADIYNSYQDHEKAETILQNEINSSEQCVKEVYADLAHTEFKLKKLDSLKLIANNMIELYPDWYAGYQKLGLYYFVKRDWNQAKDLYEKSYSLEVNGQTCSSLSTIYYEFQEHEKVRKYFMKAFELEPLNTILTRRACAGAVISFVKNDELEFARDIMKNQIKYDPEVVNYRGYKLARAYYKDSLELKEEHELLTSSTKFIDD